MQWMEHPQGVAGVGGAVDALDLLRVSGGEDTELPEGFLVDVLAALCDMALRSKRRQADLSAALRHAAIPASRALQLAAVDRLAERGWVDRVVPLIDGGVLLSVTASGLERVTGTGLV
jgi:hypothetical protein